MTGFVPRPHAADLSPSGALQGLALVPVGLEAVRRPEVGAQHVRSGQVLTGPPRLVNGRFKPVARRMVPLSTRRGGPRPPDEHPRAPSIAQTLVWRLQGHPGPHSQEPGMSNALHVLGVSRTLPFHSIGGMQAIAWDIFRMLARQGHRVTVLTTAIPGRDAPFEADGVRVEPVSSAPAERYSAAWWRDSDATALRIHAGEPVDAVLSISSAAAEMPGFRALAPHVPFLFQAHGTSWGEFQSKWRSGQPLQWLKSARNLFWIFKDARIYRRFDHIALVGDVLDRQFGAWPMPWVAGRVPRAVIRNGIDTQRFRPDAEAASRTRQRFGLDAGAPLIVFAARLHPQKGARQLMQAFEKLAARDPAPHLLIVGGGEDERALRAQAAAGAHAGRIHFTGAVDRSEMPGLLAAGQVFAFPSLRQEGLPMNVLEALACGLPAVVSTSMRPVFLPTLDLRFCNPKDADALADALVVSLNANPAGQLPRSRLTADYALPDCTQAYARLLAQPRAA